MKDTLRLGLIAGCLFALGMGRAFGQLKGFGVGIVAGAIAGVVFGGLMGLFAVFVERKTRRVLSDLVPGKSLIMDGGASHYIGAAAVGGWLYFTSDEVIFISHPFNIHVHEAVIPLDQIEEARAVLTAGILPNGLFIRTKNGIGERFLVFNRKKWAEKIEEARRARQAQF